jgi:YVTN family beta-propeller protein
MNRFVLAVVVALSLCGTFCRGVIAGDETPRLRRPVALVLSDDERWLYVANRESGTLSVVDANERRLAQEVNVGQRIADLCEWTAGRLLAVDEAGHELVVLQAKGPKVDVLRRIAVEKYPVGVAVSADGRHCYVSSLWSRRLSVLELGGDLSAENPTRHVLDLPFAPRRLLPVRGERLIVADSFGGRLGVVDPAAGCWWSRIRCSTNWPTRCGTTYTGGC